MNRSEFNDWFHKNIVMTTRDDANGLFEFTIDGRTFTTKRARVVFLASTTFLFMKLRRVRSVLLPVSWATILLLKKRFIPTCISKWG